MSEKEPDAEGYGESFEDPPPLYTILLGTEGGGSGVMVVRCEDGAAMLVAAVDGDRLSEQATDSQIAIAVAARGYRLRMLKTDTLEMAEWVGSLKEGALEDLGGWFFFRMEIPKEAWDRGVEIPLVPMPGPDGVLGATKPGSSFSMAGPEERWRTPIFFMAAERDGERYLLHCTTESDSRSATAAIGWGTEEDAQTFFDDDKIAGLLEKQYLPKLVRTTMAGVTGWPVAPGTLFYVGGGFSLIRRDIPDDAWAAGIPLRISKMGMN